MARSRDYAAEYAARKARAAERGTTVFRQREARGTIVQELGFDSYSKYRSAAEALARDFQRLRDKDIWLTPIPDRTDPIWQDMMRAKAIIGGYSQKTVDRAARERVSLLERTAEGRRIRDRLRSALGFASKNWAFYYPVMRAIY